MIRGIEAPAIKIVKLATPLTKLTHLLKTKQFFTEFEPLTIWQIGSQGTEIDLNSD